MDTALKIVCAILVPLIFIGIVWLGRAEKPDSLYSRSTSHGLPLPLKWPYNAIVVWVVIQAIAIALLLKYLD